MTVDEARALLPKYADGLLEPEHVRELESLLADRPELRDELRVIVEENELLAQALAPLRSSKSARIRLSEAMQDAHRRAQDMAEGLPEYGWRVARLCFVFLALLAATALAQFRPPTEAVLRDSMLLFSGIVGIFGMGLVFILGGRTLAWIEARLFQKFSEKAAQPSALEVLIVEVFGIFTVLGALAMYLTLLAH